MTVNDPFRSLWGSFSFDAEGADDLVPFLMKRKDKRAEIGNRHRHWCPTEIGNSLFDPGIDEAQIDFAIELVDDFSRRIFGCDNRTPRTALITRHEFSDGRNVR